jgi:hypothetical protein
VYDMYPWPREERGGGQPFPRGVRGDGSPRKGQRGVPRGRPPGLAQQAVQIALDRRDNGADAAVAADAGDAPAEPTAGPTRQ